MKQALANLIFLLLPATIYGCDNARLCHDGTYRTFIPDTVQGYHADPNDVTIWMVAEPFDGISCLPRDLAIRNLVAPDQCQVTIQPPGWIKGRPLMAVYTKGTTSTPQTISFDVYQGQAKRQTVTISIARTPSLNIIIDGKRLGEARP